MSKVNQKEAVFNAVTSTVEVVNNKALLTKAEREKVICLLVEGFEQDKIELSSKQEDLRKYTVGLLNNWLRKDTRLNGGDKYEAKNPGSRSGSADPVVKNLRLMLKTEITETQKKVIEEAIAARVSALKPKTVEVDMSVIPADILAKLGL